MNGFCNICKREWSGHSEAHCSSCCEHFSSDSAFDRHLARVDSDEVCHHPSTILRKNSDVPWFVQTERAHGLVWMKRDDREHPFSSVGALSDSSAG